VTAVTAVTEQHLTVEELAHREQVAIQTVYGWNCRKSGPRYMRIGRGRGGVRYRLADVLAWEEARLV
jgi:predicted DNA-binding transcriptional regulator AlpA